MKLAISIAACILLIGCTLSFQNISTHGTATDLVDQDQEASPDISPNLVIPPASTLGYPSL